MKTLSNSYSLCTCKCCLSVTFIELDKYLQKCLPFQQFSDNRIRDMVMCSAYLMSVNPYSLGLIKSPV